MCLPRPGPQGTASTSAAADSSSPVLDGRPDRRARSGLREHRRHLGGSSARGSPLHARLQLRPAGLGQSDPAPAGVRTVQDSVDDLHALLGAAGIAGPYVLVGHSLGGLIVRLYASQYPNDVAGLVLVDGIPPDLPASGLALLPAAERQETFTIMRGLHPQDPEHLDIIASGVWVMAHPPPPVPTVVLAAGFHGAQGAPPDATFEELWQELQREQARDLDARFVPVPEADHFLHQDRPQVVVEAIDQLVEAVRHPST